MKINFKGKQNLFFLCYFGTCLNFSNFAAPNFNIEYVRRNYTRSNPKRI